MRSKISAREKGQKQYQSKNPCRQSGFRESSRWKEVSFKLTAKSGKEVHVRKASGREFQIVGAEKEKDLLPKLDFVKKH